MRYLVALLIAGFCSLTASPAMAYTCTQHYEACLRYGHGETKCGCARNVCQKRVGSGDAGAKWNGIAGINACFKKG